MTTVRKAAHAATSALAGVALAIGGLATLAATDPPSAGAATSGPGSPGAAPGTSPITAGATTSKATISNPTRHLLAYASEPVANAVAVIDTQASPPSLLGTISTTTPTAQTCHPQSVTSSPTLAWVYVGCTGRTTTDATHSLAHGGIVVVNTTTNSVASELHLGADPISIAVSPDGKTLYALSLAGSTGNKFAVDVVSLSAAGPMLAATASLPAGQWVNPTSPGALAVNSTELAVAASDAQTTTQGGAVDLWTVSGTGAISSAPPTEYAFGGPIGSPAPSAVVFNPMHPAVLYAAPGATGGATARDQVTAITVTAGTLTESSWATAGRRIPPYRDQQIASTPSGAMLEVTITAVGTLYAGPLTITSGHPLTLAPVATPPGTTRPTAPGWVSLGSTSTVPSLGEAHLPGSTELYVVRGGLTPSGTPGAVMVLSTGTNKLIATTPLPVGAGTAGVTFGQPASPQHTTTPTPTTTGGPTSQPAASTTTALSSSLNPSRVGLPITLTATVAATGGAPAGGTVEFRSGTTTLGAAPVTGGGTATLTTATLPAGTDLLTATFSSNSLPASASSPLDETVAIPPGSPMMTAMPTGKGYWEVASDGGVFTFGSAQFYGSMGGHPLNAPVVGMATTPTGDGYWLVASDGGIFAFGDAGFYGSMGGHPLNAPIVGMVAAATGQGYWEVASDGGIFAFGSAAFLGSMGGHPLNEPVVGLAATPNDQGYWEVASDGGIFAFGNAQFYGSMGGKHLNAPVAGMAPALTGKGYWEVASDGGVFTFGSAQFYGSMGGHPLNAPVVGMATTPTGDGYWLVASDGGVFAFGSAQFYGSMGGKPLNGPGVGIAATPTGKGYWVTANDGGVFSYGDAVFYGSMGGQPLNAPVEGPLSLHGYTSAPAT